MGFNPESMITGAVSGLLDFGSGVTSAAMSRNAYRHRYQDTVQDLRKAGLNPALAYGQGGGGGAQNQEIPRLGESVTRGIQTAASARQAAASADLTAAQSTLLKLQSADLVDQVKIRNQLLQAEIGLTGQRTGLTAQQIQTETQRTKELTALVEQAVNQKDFLNRTYQDRVLLIEQQVKAAGLDITRKEIENELARLSQPEARASAAFYEGAGRYSPYVNSALDIVKALMPKSGFGGTPTMGPTWRPPYGRIHK